MEILIVCYVRTVSNQINVIVLKISAGFWPYSFTVIATAITTILAQLFLGHRSVQVFVFAFCVDMLALQDIRLDAEQVDLRFHMYHGCYHFRDGYSMWNLV